MAWYAVRILFEIRRSRSEPARSILYDDSIMVVKAKDENAAAKKGLRHGRSKMETSYKNYRGETVTWKVKKLMDARELLDNEIKEFTEIYSCFYRGWYPKPVIRPFKKRRRKGKRRGAARRFK